MNISKHTSIQFLIVLFSAVVLMSCGGGSKSSQESGNQEAFDEAEKKIAEDITKVIEDLPAPTEVPYMLQAAGADYNEGLINGLESLDTYETIEDEAALNLGVYATDMGYLLSYDKVSESREYLEANQRLAEALNIASVFDLKTMESFQENLDNSDTLNSIISDAIEKAEVKLQKSDRVAVAALVLSGSFIEGLYLAVKVIEEYPTDVLDEDTRNLILEPLVRVILDQEKPLTDIIAMLKDLPQDKMITKMITELNILKLLYEGDLADIQQKISENTGNFMLTQDMLLDVTTEVKRIRADIVNVD